MLKSGAASVRARALAWGKPRGARAADLSVAAAEQEDGPQDDLAGDAQVGCTASKNNETELRKLRDEIQSLKDENQSLKDEIQPLKDEIQSLKQDETQSLKQEQDEIQSLKQDEIQSLQDEIQSLKQDETQSLKQEQDEIQSLKQDEIQSLKDQLNNVSTPGATTNSRDGKAKHPLIATALSPAAASASASLFSAAAPPSPPPPTLPTSVPRPSYQVDAEPVPPISAEWSVAGWVDSLALAEVVAKALKEPPGTTDPFKYVLGLSLADLKEKLEAVKLSEAIAETLWSAIEKLHGQSAATGAALNAKFAAEGDAFKGEMGFGGVEQFYGGVLHASLEKLIGAPLMVDGSLFKAMETEHCTEKDADEPFATSNGVKGATPRLEWEFVVKPVVADQDSRYVERGGDFRTAHRELCRKAEPLSVYEKKMADEMNPRLVEAGQAPLTLEELVAGRMYTGPMYEKYNGVLRFFSARGADGTVLLEYASEEEVPFLQKRCGQLHLGEWAATAAGKGWWWWSPAAVRWTWHNQYATTIHAINSIIVKLSPLTKITPLYRGWMGSTLPEGFFKPDALGFRGGVEYGFSSTTTDRAQAVHYAAGKASTVLELVMGMISRGADISWLSQYPHEAETLLPPLMGLQVRSTGVEGSTLVVQGSFSINMASQTLEQVTGKRKKLLTDMGAQMAAEVRRGVAEEAAEEAAQLVRVNLGLERGEDAGGDADQRPEAPLGDEAEAYNDDLRFQAAVDDALKVKRAAVLAATMQHGGGGGLAVAMDAVLPLQAGLIDLTGFDLGSDDGEMVGMVVAWMESEPSALMSLTLDWGKACGRVREALLGVVRTTRTLVALRVGEEGAMTLNPLQLSGLEAVTSLDLSSKGLGPGSAAVVAAGLSVNEVLTSLDVGGNNLTEEAVLGIVRVERRRNKLTSLGFADCGIGPTGAAEITEYVSGSAVLTDLNLGYNQIRDEGAAAIAQALRSNEVLINLYIGSNRIGERGAKALASALCVNTVLTTLDISENDIGDKGAKAIGKALAVNGVMTSLNVGGNRITEESALGIVSADGERKRSKLTSLGLASCGIGPTGAAKIAEYVSGSAVLTTLHLSNNNIGDKGAKALAPALRANAVLTDLDLSHNGIREEGAALGKALEINEVLAKLNLDGHELDLPKLRGTDPVESLDLSSKDLGPASAIVIAASIAGNAVLTDLNLSRNKIGDEGAKALASALRVNAVLKIIDIRSNSLGTEGWCAIFATLRDNKENKIKSWDLSGQGINAEVAKVLAEYVSASKVLTDLNLGRNRIGDEGAKALASALRVSKVLKTLDLYNNQIPAEGAAAIAEALRGNAVLTSLDVGFNNLTEEAVLGIVRVERRRNKLTSLGFADCGIGPTGAAEIAAYASGSEVLKSLDLSGNKIVRTDTVVTTEWINDPYFDNWWEEEVVQKTHNTSGITALANALKANAVLTNLDLSGNNIGGCDVAASASEVGSASKKVGARVIYQGRTMVVSEAVESDYSGLGDMKLTDLTGVLAIADALKVNTVLKTLHLADNMICSEGTKAIGEALTINEQVRVTYTPRVASSD